MTWRSRACRVLVILAIAALVLVFFILGLNRSLDLGSLRSHERWLRGFTDDHQLSAGSIFVAVYMMTVALSLPGATILSLTGGLLFGFWTGLALNLAGATTGSIAIVALGRYLIGDALRARGGMHVARMAAGFERNAFSYVIFLRLVPLFPFWAINLAAAAFAVPLRSFAFATLIGILPGTLAVTSIGNGLSLAAGARGQGWTDVLGNPWMIWLRIILALLALIPLLPKWWKRRSDP